MHVNVQVEIHSGMMSGPYLAGGQGGQLPPQAVT